MKRSQLVYIVLLTVLSCLLLWQWYALRSMRPLPREIMYDTVHVERAVPHYVSYSGDTVVRARKAPDAAALLQPAVSSPAEANDSSAVSVEIMSSDSVDVVLPVHEHIYTDDSTYRVRVLGSYIQRADIDIINRTERIVQPVRHRVKVRPCIYVGYGFTYARGIRAGPQVGGGLSITF